MLGSVHSIVPAFCYNSLPSTRLKFSIIYLYVCEAQLAPVGTTSELTHSSHPLLWSEILTAGPQKPVNERAAVPRPLLDLRLSVPLQPLCFHSLFHSHTHTCRWAKLREKNEMPLPAGIMLRG